MANWNDLFGGGLPVLVPDLTFPSSLNSGGGVVTLAAIDASVSLTTLLSLTGKYSISYLNISGLTAENITVKLTIDGVVIWNDTFVLVGSEQNLLGLVQGGNSTSENTFSCLSTMTLELQTATDTSINFAYLVRPIK